MSSRSCGDLRARQAMVTGSAETHSIPGDSGAEVIVESERESFFYSDAAGADTALGEETGDERGGAFVFLPDTNFDGIAHELAHAALFERGSDKEWRTGARNDKCKEAFARSPADAGEIVERGAGPEEDGVKFCIELRHEFLGMEEPGVELVGSDGMDAIAERFQGGERRGKLGLRVRGR